jgi:NADPH:quinone reductase-like Zn-dependent oxidoreductase
MHAMAQTSWRRGEPLHWLELPTPEPRPDEVRVAVRAIGVNPVDWKLRSMGPLRLAARLVGPPLPFITGVDFAGLVEAVGARVTRFSVGQRVVGGTHFARGQRGSYATAVIVREDQLAEVPPGVDLATAGALPVAGVTAQIALFELGRLLEVPPEARRVLVLGASGGVGQLAVQLARRAGAFVAGVCSQRNAALVSSLGAAAVLDYGEGDPLTAAASLGPWQVIVDCVGTYSARRLRRQLRPGGRHAMVAGDSPLAALQVLAPPFTSRALLAVTTTARLSAVLEAVADGAVQVHLAHRLPLREAEAAHALSQSGRVAGKIILEP